MLYSPKNVLLMTYWRAEHSKCSVVVAKLSVHIWKTLHCEELNVDGRGDFSLTSDFCLVGLFEHYHRCFFHQDCFVVCLPCTPFSRSLFCAFLLFWHVSSVHLTSLSPPSSHTTFYVWALNVFEQSDTTLTGSERGPLSQHMHVQHHFKHACCYYIISSFIALDASSTLAL